MTSRAQRVETAAACEETSSVPRGTQAARAVSKRSFQTGAEVQRRAQSATGPCSTGQKCSDVPSLQRVLIVRGSSAAACPVRNGSLQTGAAVQWRAQSVRRRFASFHRIFVEKRLKIRKNRRRFAQFYQAFDEKPLKHENRRRFVPFHRGFVEKLLKIRKIRGVSLLFIGFSLKNAWKYEKSAALRVFSSRVR